MTAVDVEFVNPETGEIAQMSTRSEAEQRAERIRRKRDDFWADVEDDLVAAFHARDWVALGYDGWPNYVEGEFGSAVATLAKKDRSRFVLKLKGEGLSNRAIASTAGVSEGTVRNDLAGAQNYAPDPATPVVGMDGKSYRPTKVTERESFSKTTEYGDDKPSTADDGLHAEPTWADVVAAYPHAEGARPGDREGIRRSFAQLQTMSGAEKVKRERAFLNFVDHSCRTDEERAARKAESSNGPTVCPTCRQEIRED